LCGFPDAERLLDEALNLVGIELGAGRAIHLHRVGETRARPMQSMTLGDALIRVARTGVGWILTELAAHRTAIGGRLIRPAERGDRARDSYTQLRPARA